MGKYLWVEIKEKGERKRSKGEARSKRKPPEEEGEMPMKSGSRECSTV